MGAPEQFGFLFLSAIIGANNALKLTASRLAFLFSVGARAA